MTVIPHKVKRQGKEYYELIDVKRVKGKTVQKYVGYLGRTRTQKRRLSQVICFYTLPDSWTRI